ncbi:outer membrane protein assembly factor BamA [Celeribacter arenosi]|uniref:Outer membrane protein assembly factor BamA n=2 Tax=Celeribacter arenosi TaxID=792649 RepID=A0ABP7KFS4_9RHOB
MSFTNIGSMGPRHADRPRFSFLFTLFAAIALVLTLGTVRPVEAQDFRFTSVSIEGSQRVSADTILSYAGIAQGETVSAAELNDAYQAVIASGLFETVEFVPQGSRLVIRVTEFPVVSRIAIEGNRVIDDNAIGNLIQTRVRRVYSPATVEADAKAITEAYEARGQLAATVTPQIIRRPENRVDVVFEIRESRGVEIERLSFVGNRAFSDGRLRRVLETKQAGLFRFIVGRDTFAADRVEFDKRVLTDFYTSRGYVDFEVLNAAAEFSRDRGAYFLTFTVREGNPYDFGTLTVSSEIAQADPADFEKLIRIRKGQTYSPVAVENAIARMEQLATRDGIDFLRVEPRVTRNDRDLTLDIEFNLVRGPRVFVERIDIEGNATTLDRVVRRQFNTVEGDPFNPREIREAASRIRALGFFSDASVNAREGSAQDRVVVDVDVDEQPTGSFTFGANYSVAEGASLVASFSESNFLGRGQSLSFNLTTRLEDGSLSFNFVEPAFLGRDVAFGLSAGIGTSAPIYADHEQRQASVSPRLTFPVSERGRLTVNYRGALSEIRNPDGNVLPAIIQADLDAGRVTTHSLGYRYDWDSRRDGINPDTGIRVAFGQDYAVGGDVDYVRSSAEVSALTTIMNGDVDLRATIEGGVIQSDQGTRVNDRFFTGPSIIRGFEPGGIGPRDTATGLALGGNYYAVARLEAVFPLGLPEEYGVRGGLFFDYGSLWGLDDDTGTDGSAEREWRSVVGASIFWTTPIGPLRFNFSRALDKETYDLEQTFDLTISTSF